MMGCKTLQMIHDRYYSYIKNYQRDDGSAFMENVYNASKNRRIEGCDEKSGPNEPQTKNGELAHKANSPIIL
jgi:hypothetical protein